MLEVMMALGQFRFALNSAAYNELFSTQDWEWAEQDRIGTYPALQYTGPSVETKQLKGIIYPTFRGGLGQIEKIREQANKGMPLLLVSGRGRVLGQWCITHVEHTDTVFFADGSPRKVEFNIQLKRYDDGSNLQNTRGRLR